MYNDLEDNILQGLIVKRDKVAFHALYVRYWDRVFVMCMQRLNNEVVAEDIVQDIFVSIWENKKIIDVVNLEAYLFQAVKFSVIKFLHKSNREKNIDTSQYGILDRVSDLSLEDALETKFIKDLIFQEVERLPERTKIIFRYSRVQHMTSHEIAEELNISSRTVENQISNALRSLRKYLKKIQFFILF